MTDQQPPDQQPPPSAAPTPAAGSPAFLDGLLWLLGFWLGGELAVRALDVPVPGAVVGMLALFAMLQWRARRSREEPADLIRAADGLLAHLQLLFVPAGVGIVAVLGVLRDDALPVIGALVISWAVGLVVVGWAVTLLLPRERRARSAGGAS